MKGPNHQLTTLIEMLQKILRGRESTEFWLEIWGALQCQLLHQEVEIRSNGERAVGTTGNDMKTWFDSTRRWFYNCIMTSLLGFGVFVWKPIFTKVVNLNWLRFVFLLNFNWIEYEVPLETCWCNWGFGARPPGRVDTLAEMEGSTQVYHVM